MQNLISMISMIFMHKQNNSQLTVNFIFNDNHYTAIVILMSLFQTLIHKKVLVPKMQIAQQGFEGQTNKKTAKVSFSRLHSSNRSPPCAFFLSFWFNLKRQKQM